MARGQLPQAQEATSPPRQRPPFLEPAFFVEASGLRAAATSSGSPHAPAGFCPRLAGHPRLHPCRRSGAAVRPSWKLRVWRTRQWGLKGQLATTSRRPLRRAGDTGLSHTCGAPGRGTAGGSASARVGGCDRHTHLCGKTGDGGPTSKTAPGCGPRVAPAFSVTPFWVFPGFLQCVRYFSNQRSLKLPSRLGAVFDVWATVCPPEPGFCNVPRSQLGSRDSGSRGPRTEQQQLSQKREGPRTLPGLSGQRSTPREPPGARNTEHKARGPGRKA